MCKKDVKMTKTEYNNGFGFQLLDKGIVQF
jgi:hypothetical protein